MIRFPRSPQDLSEMLDIILEYNQKNTTMVTVIWVYLYILYSSLKQPAVVRHPRACLP